MADLVVEQWPIGRLREYERNPRRNDDQVDRMAAAITEFGFRIPIVAKSDGEVVDGHLRLKAAHKLGLATVPVALADGLTDAQIKAFRLLANKSASWAQWDDKLLALEIGDLAALGFDLGLTGFTAPELALLGAKTAARGSDPEDTPEPPTEPVSRLGDVWVLGNHRLVCGDSCDPAAVALCLDGAVPHLMVTDPPYGVEYDPAWRAKRGINKNKSKMGVVLNDDRSDWRAAWALFPGDVAYVWHAGLHADSVAASLKATDFAIRSQIIWNKDRFVLSRSDYHWRHEPCWYAVRAGKTGHWAGGRSQDTIWNIASRDDNGVGHGTQKPVECMRRPIANNSEPGDHVYDPFLGSSTSIIAAEMTGRFCHGIELSPQYVDVGVMRWQAFTGKVARLASSGKSFDEMRVVRITSAPPATHVDARPSARRA